MEQKENRLKTIGFTAFFTQKWYNKVQGFNRSQIFFRAVFNRKIPFMERKTMYKYTDNTQSNFLDFNQPIGLHMNSENRWVKWQMPFHGKFLKRNYSHRYFLHLFLAAGTIDTSIC